MEISEEKQIEEMAREVIGGCEECSKCPLSFDCKAYEYATKFYNAGYRKQEWISVKERLPERCGMSVLMVAVNEYKQIKVVKGFTDYACPIDFRTNEREFDGIWHAWKVTHWMPLPELPKMEGE